MYRIIGADGREYGPIPEATLRQWIIEGRANTSTRVLPEGGAEWKLLGSLAEFSMLFAAHAPSPAVYATGPVVTQKNTAFATTGMILGIISLPFCFCCYGMPFNLLGLIFSVIALAQIKSDPAHYGGRGMAIAGLVLSILSLVLAVLFLILVGIGASMNPATHHVYRL